MIQGFCGGVVLSGHDAVPIHECGGGAVEGEQILLCLTAAHVPSHVVGGELPEPGQNQIPDAVIRHEAGAVPGEGGKNGIPQSGQIPENGRRTGVCKRVVGVHHIGIQNYGPERGGIADGADPLDSGVHFPVHAVEDGIPGQILIEALFHDFPHGSVHHEDVEIVVPGHELFRHGEGIFVFIGGEIGAHGLGGISRGFHETEGIGAVAAGGVHTVKTQVQRLLALIRRGWGIGKFVDQRVVPPEGDGEVSVVNLQILDPHRAGIRADENLRVVFVPFPVSADSVCGGGGERIHTVVQDAVFVIIRHVEAGVPLNVLTGNIPSQQHEHTGVPGDGIIFHGAVFEGIIFGEILLHEEQFSVLYGHPQNGGVDEGFLTGVRAVSVEVKVLRIKVQIPVQKTEFCQRIILKGRGRDIFLGQEISVSVKGVKREQTGIGHMGSVGDGDEYIPVREILKAVGGKSLIVSCQRDHLRLGGVVMIGVNLDPVEQIRIERIVLEFP